MESGGAEAWDEYECGCDGGYVIRDKTGKPFDVSERQWVVDEYWRPIDGSEPARPISATQAEEGSVSFSPDGRFVLAGNFAITAVHVWDVSPAGAAEWANLPVDETSVAAFSPDGGALYAAETYTCRLMKFNITSPGKVAPDAGPSLGKCRCGASACCRRTPASTRHAQRPDFRGADRHPVRRRDAGRRLLEGFADPAARVRPDRARTRASRRSPSAA